jgi:integrase
MAATSRNNAQPASGPILVTTGRTTVSIYPRAAARGRKAGFYVASYATGKRRLLWFTDLKEAKAEAARIAALTNAGDALGAQMTGKDRSQYLRATELVAPFALDPQTACALFAKAAELVGADNVVAAAKAFAKRSPASRERLPLRKAVDLYLASKATKGRSDRHVADLRSRLGRFVADHPGKALADITTSDLQTWLDQLKREDGAPLSPQSRRNFAVVVGGMLNHHRRRGAIADNPAVDLEREKVRSTSDIEFWSPTEAEALLCGCPAVALPALAIGLFAGLRTAEVARLRWEDVDFKQRHVAVLAGNAKTASRRLVPMTNNLLEWLLPFRADPKALVYPEHATTLSKRITEAAEASGVRRLANGARHSWVTYRVADSGDVARTASEAGNSVGVIHGHYRGLCTRDDAQRFFGIRPTAPDNLVAMPASA